MSTGQRELLCGREGNRRSGVVLAMLHRLCGISIYGLNGLRKGDQHHAYTHLRNSLPTAINLRSLLTCCKWTSTVYTMSCVTAYDKVQHGCSIFRERELKFTFAICYRPSVCRLSVVCDVRAPYSGSSNFRQYFYGIRYLGHPLTFTENVTEIVPEEPLRRGS